jgi:hypothetical protein
MVKKLQKVAKALGKASKLHKKQSKIIKKHIKEMKRLLQKSNESANLLQGKYKSLQLVSKERKLWVRARWLAYLREARMRSEKTRKFNGRTYRVSDLKEGPYKKKLVKGLMSARRDVGTALKKKDKKMERNARNRVHKFKKKLGER